MSSISAGDGVGLGTSGSTSVSISDTGLLLGCVQRDVAAHVLAFEFDLLRARQGTLTSELQRRSGRGDAEHAPTGHDEAAVAHGGARMLDAHARQRLGALDALDRLPGARRLRVAGERP